MGRCRRSYQRRGAARLIDVHCVAAQCREAANGFSELRVSNLAERISRAAEADSDDTLGLGEECLVHPRCRRELGERSVSHEIHPKQSDAG